MRLKLLPLERGSSVVWVTRKEGIKRGLVVGIATYFNGEAHEVVVIRDGTGYMESWLLWQREMGPCWRVTANAG